jgi:hypothetical protein
MRAYADHVNKTLAHLATTKRILSGALYVELMGWQTGTKTSTSRSQARKHTRQLQSKKLRKALQDQRLMEKKLPSHIHQRLAEFISFFFVPLSSEVF